MASNCVFKVTNIYIYFFLICNLINTSREFFLLYNSLRLLREYLLLIRSITTVLIHRIYCPRHETPENPWFLLNHNKTSGDFFFFLTVSKKRGKIDGSDVNIQLSSPIKTNKNLMMFINQYYCSISWIRSNL